MEKRNVTVSAIVAAIVLIGDQLSKHCVTWKTGARPSA